MSTSNYYAMTDEAVAETLGERLEQARLEANIPQKALAEELGVSENTLRNALRGKAKLELFIGILRVLGKLDNVDLLLPDTPFSPIELLKLEGKKRQRAGTKRSRKGAAGKSDIAGGETGKDDEPW